MELVVRKNDLLHELQLFQGIIERKNTIPILANVLLEAKGKEVCLLATDLEVALRSRCAAKVSKGGALTLPAKKLFEIVRALPDTDITISEEGQSGVKVSADRFESRMQTLPLEDFPTLPNPETKQAIPLPAAALREMVAKTQFAITGEDTRYFLNGALFVLDGSQMTLVATDGHRLALVSADRGKSGKSKKDDARRVIFPKKTLGELSRLLTDDDKEIKYQHGENHLFFEIDKRVLISRMIDAQFPAYERVIPKTNDKTIEFERDRLTSAIKRVALLSNERSRAVKFQMDTGVVEITANSPEVGEAREELAVDYNNGKVQVCFNAQYMLDFLSAVETDNVRLEFKDETSQAVMRPVGAEGYDYTYVIMPMRI